MPSGSNKTGRKTPHTPGSRRVGEDITLIGARMGKRDAVCKAVRIRRHRTYQRKKTTAQPQNHTAANSAAHGKGVAATGVAAVVTGNVNGWLICWIADESGGATAEALRHSNRLPTLTSSENGIRNLIDADNQSQ